jgi:maltose phosphorylase
MLTGRKPSGNPPGQQGVNEGFVTARTFKTRFGAATYMHNSIFLNGNDIEALPVAAEATESKVQFTYSVEANQNDTVGIVKFGGYTVTLNHAEDALIDAANAVIASAKAKGYDALLEEQKQAGRAFGKWQTLP